jgi:dTDP-4-dehydrorhamnose 3,5-epimerase
VNITPTTLKDCVIIEPKVFTDSRGIFFESFNKKILEKELNTQLTFVQDNHSVSVKGALRGLHFQKGNKSQAKLVRVVQGAVLDVVVDLRKDSPTFKKHFKTVLTSESRHMIYIPKGMAHGFIAVQNNTVFLYKCDSYYDKESESGIFYNDPDLNIDWEFDSDQLILSDKDRELPLLKDLDL